MKNFKKVVAILGVFVLVASCFMPLTVDAGPAGPANPGDAPAGPVNPNDPAGPVNPNDPAGPNEPWGPRPSCDGHNDRPLITNPEIFWANEPDKCYHWTLEELLSEYSDFSCEEVQNAEAPVAGPRALDRKNKEYTCSRITDTWDDNTWDDDAWNDQSNNWWTIGGGYSGWGSHRGSSSSDSSEEIVLRWEVLLWWEDTSASESDLAREWAIENGLIDSEADLVKTLTRWDLASLTLNYITKLTSLQQKSLEDVVYWDDNSQTLQSVYKYQVMGIHADGSALDNFGANQMTTKAESITVFDRVLHGLQNNIDGANFYEKHASVLKSEGIVDNNVNLTDLETKGGVIMMMYRHELKK